MNTVCLLERIRDLCMTAKQVIYASAFSTTEAFCAKALAELSLSVKKTITLEMYTQGCSKGSGQKLYRLSLFTTRSDALSCYLPVYLHIFQYK